MWLTTSDEPARAVTQHDLSDVGGKARYMAFISKRAVDDPFKAVASGDLKSGEWTMVGLEQRIEESPLAFSVHVVTANETSLETLGSILKMDSALLGELNGIYPGDKIKPNTKIAYISSAAADYVAGQVPTDYKLLGLYAVRPGETLDGLASRWNVSTPQLQEANPELDSEIPMPAGDLIERIGPIQSPAAPVSNEAQTGVAQVGSQAVPVYKFPGAPNPIGTLPPKAIVSILGNLKTDGFYKIEFIDPKTDLRGFIRIPEVSVIGTLSSPPAYADQHLDGVAAIALRYIGTPYAWGGSSLTKGIDCSHFVTQVFKVAGQKCPPAPVTVQENYGYVVIAKGNTWARRNGRHLDTSAYPSDLAHTTIPVGSRIIIQYRDSDAAKTRHTGIYLGAINYKGRRYMHAVVNAGVSHGVRIDDLGTRAWFWKDYKYFVFGSQYLPSAKGLGKGAH
jgi:hypothetical protein